MGTVEQMTAVRGGDWMKEGEGIGQRTYTHNPHTQTPVW